MATVNSLLENEHVAHAVSLEQYKLGVVRRIIAQLNRSDASLAAALTETLERMLAKVIDRTHSMVNSTASRIGPTSSDWTWRGTRPTLRAI